MLLGSPIWPMGENTVMTAIADDMNAIVLRAVPDGQGPANCDPVDAWDESVRLGGPVAIIRFATIPSIDGLLARLAELRARMSDSGDEKPIAKPTTSGDVGKLCERLLSEVRFLKTLTDADIERSGTMESTMVRAGLLSEILTAFEAQAARIAALEKALEPSLETKVEYIGEVRETLTMRDEDGEEYSYQHTISWDATKDIMKMIRAYADECTARALLNPTPTEER